MSHLGDICDATITEDGYTLSSFSIDPKGLINNLYKLCETAGVHFITAHISTRGDLMHYDGDVFVNCTSAPIGGEHSGSGGGGSSATQKAACWVGLCDGDIAVPAIADISGDEHWWVFARPPNLKTGRREVVCGGPCGDDSSEKDARKHMADFAPDELGRLLNEVVCWDRCSTLTRPVCTRGKHSILSIEWDDKHPRLLHNYGYGGAGFTLGWGMAEHVTCLILKAIE